MNLPAMDMLTLFLVLMLQKVACKKGYVNEVHSNQKFACSGMAKKLYKVASEMQCVHRCLHQSKCGALNYQEGHGETSSAHNCEIYQQSQPCSLLPIKSWKAMLFQVDEPLKVYKSCKEVAAGNPNAKDGVYQLQDGKHFCKMTSLGLCGNGGWTLALKMDGSKTTFTMNSAYWTNDVTYSIENGLTSFEGFEAKFPAFSKIKFDAVCVGMTFAGATKWLRINIKQDSLLHIFKAGTYIPTYLGRAAWKSIIAQSSLQLNCNREGFNVRRADNAMLARIGYIANEQSDCNSPDSAIGFGLAGSWKSCGNSASSSPDNGDKQNAAIGYILVQ